MLYYFIALLKYTLFLLKFIINSYFQGSYYPKICVFFGISLF